jgi:cytochrome c peroxidase
VEAVQWWEANGSGDRPSDPFEVIRDFMDGGSVLTAREIHGHDLFYGNATCAIFCHNTGGPVTGTDWPIFNDNGRIIDGELYTGFGFFNIGFPANPENPQYELDPDFADRGLYENTGDSVHIGDFKEPTLRNVDKRPGKGFVKAYSHNGYFKSLEGIVHFYNTRDTKPTCKDKNGEDEYFLTEREALKRGCWPAAEIVDATNIFGCAPGRTYDQCREEDIGEDFCDDKVLGDAGTNIGHLCQSAEEEAEVVAYLKALTDLYTPKEPKPLK